MKHEGKLVLKARIETSRPQYWLAKKLGISAQFLGKIEKGHVKLPLTHVERFCKLTGMPKSELLRAKVKDFKEYCEQNS